MESYPQKRNYDDDDDDTETTNEALEVKKKLKTATIAPTVTSQIVDTLSTTSMATATSTIESEQLSDSALQQQQHQPSTLEANLFEDLTTLELRWLNEHSFVEYSNVRDYRCPTVLYSHQQSKHFVSSKITDNVCVSSMSKYFENRGHTLCVDYKLSYVRPMALDVDCLCCHTADVANTNPASMTFAQRPQSCSELVIGSIVQKLRDLLSSFSDDKHKNNMVVSVWNRVNSHNYHIYTNYMVGLPTYAYIVNALNNLLRSNECIIDCPEYMPLPYSFKKINGIVINSEPYTRSEQSNKVFSVYPKPDVSFYDYCYFTSTNKGLHILSFDGKNNNSNEDKTTPTNVYFTCDNAITLRNRIPLPEQIFVSFTVVNNQTIPNVIKSTCETYFRHLLSTYLDLYMSHIDATTNIDYDKLNGDKKFLQFIVNNKEELTRFFVRLNTKLGYEEVDPDIVYFKTKSTESTSPTCRRQSTDNNSKKHTNVIESSSSSDSHVEKLFDDDDDDDEEDSDDEYNANITVESTMTTTTTTTLSRTNNKLIVQNEPFDVFVRESAYRNNAWNLQHYVVALHKALTDKHNIKDLKYFLRRLYECSKYGTNPLPRCVFHFIDHYHQEIEMSYLYYSDDIIDYMRTIFLHSLTPRMTVTETFTKIFLDMVHCESINEYAATLRTPKNTLKMDAMNNLFDTVMKIIKENKFIVKIGSFTYILDNTHWYYVRYVASNMSFFLNWPRDIRAKLNKEIGDGNCSENYKSGKIFHAIPYMIATECGVFNSITGLYVSPTPLLSFVKCRRYVLYPKIPLKHTEAYAELNDELLEFREKYSKFFFDIVCNKYHIIYTYYSFIPAITSLRHVYRTDKLSIIKFFEAAMRYTLEEASCLVELYPFNRNLIVYILLLVNMYGLEMLCDYQKLSLTLFNTMSSTSVLDWQRHYRHLTNYDYDQPLPHFNDDNIDPDDPRNATVFTAYPYLRELCSYDDGEITINESDCVLSVSLLAALFKNPTYSTMFEAFGYEKNAMPTPTPYNRITDWNNSRHYTPSLNTYKRITNRTMKILLKDREQNSIERALYTTIIQLSFCVSFDKVKIKELLNMMGMTMVTTNMLKLICIFFGAAHSGKSFVLDTLTYALNPSVYASTKHLEKHNERSGVISKNLMVRCNELNSIDPMTLKSYTGEDPACNQVFFTQNYEYNDSGQALFYVGTNYYITFRDDTNKAQPPLEPTVIKRLHAITFNGEHYNEDDVFDGKSSLFEMIASSKFFIGVTENSEQLKHFATMWLLFENYVYSRNECTMRPIVDTNIEDSINYRQTVYCANSDLYKFLDRCNICYFVGFKIRKRVFMDTVSRNFCDANAQTYKSMTRQSFFEKFRLMYNVSLNDMNDDDYLDNFQFSALVVRIIEEMRVEEAIGECITGADLEARLNALYDNEDDRHQARSYFQRVNSRFMQRVDSINNSSSSSISNSFDESNETDDNVLSSDTFVLQNYRFVPSSSTNIVSTTSSSSSRKNNGIEGNVANFKIPPIIIK
ncbi:helicase [Phenacoccus solenopsis nudivirus]|nr:helicase [Phenacoccus solenopsis nudivirus]